MKTKQLLSGYDLSQAKIPEEVLNINIGNKLYDKKYLIIKKWLLSCIRK